MMCLQTAGCVANSVDPDQMLQYAAYDRDLHCLFKLVYPNTVRKYGNHEKVHCSISELLHPIAGVKQNSQ